MRCPVCDGPLVSDRKRGRVACAQCGLVAAESAVDVGPERRVFDGGSEKAINRYGVNRMKAKRYMKLQPRCVYVDNKPLEDVRILLVQEEIIRVIVIVGCREFYAFLFKRDAKEYLRRRFGLEQFEVRRCN
jgi:transcription initiation factor TFIIIB Brf1 subunit/transcription initiation factor TFIIB